MGSILGNQILIADDDFVSLRLLEFTLKKSGFEVIAATNGTEALEFAKNVLPDVIILDVMMPEPDGFAVCSLLKADNVTADIPVIFITSLEDKQSRVKGLSIGGVDYITKPFFKEEVLARIRIHLRLQSALRLLLDDQRKHVENLRKANQKFITDLDALPNSRCAVVFDPLEEVGGDIYGAFALQDGTWCYYVGDIAGHGLEMTFFSSILKALIRDIVRNKPEAEPAFMLINERMRKYLAEGQFITAALVLIDRNSGTASLFSAGHLPPLIQYPDGGIEKFIAEGDVLGVFPQPAFIPTIKMLPPGTRIWLYSDGIVERFSASQNHRVGISRLQTVIGSTTKIGYREAVHKVATDLFDESHQDDDRLLMVVEV